MFSKAFQQKVFSVCTLNDFTPDEFSHLVNENEDLYFSIKEPLSHSFYLGANNLLLLDSNKDKLLSEFFSYFADSELLCYTTKLPCDMENWLIELTGTEKSPKFPGFVYFSTSPYGNQYFKKISLSSDIGHKIHKEVVKYNEPNLFLYFIYSYLSTESFTMSDNWYLFSKARKEFLTHDLSQFILYKEQAIFLGCSILSQLHDTSEENRQLDHTERWARDLAISLIKYSDRLPSDDSGLYKDLSLFNPAFFAIYPEVKNKIFQNKYFSFF